MKKRLAKKILWTRDGFYCGPAGAEAAPWFDAERGQLVYNAKHLTPQVKKALRRMRRYHFRGPYFE